MHLSCEVGLSYAGVRRGDKSSQGHTAAPLWAQAPHPQLRLRGIQQGAIQKRSVVVILEVIPLLTEHRAVGGLVVGSDADGVRRVVEVDHVDVKHQHGRAWDIPYRTDTGNEAGTPSSITTCVLTRIQ